MESTANYMGELVRIVNGALRLDLDKVRNYTAFLADKLEKSGDASSAARLRRMLEETESQLRPVGTSFAVQTPVDSESRFPLVEKVKFDAESEPPIVLEPEQWSIVNEYLSIAKSSAQAEAEGIVGSLSLLLCGPPGTGKSRLVRYIAGELGLELYIARLDGLISSYVGSTSKNIRAIFEFAASTPCILFLDEFDAIAKVRGDAQELGELKRVVNSFIQNLDMIGSQSLVIAATNHDELLDAAVWRRFAYRLMLQYPSADARRELWSSFAKSLKFSKRDLELLVDLSGGFSGSDIAEVCRRLQRRRITFEQSPTLKDAFEVLRNLSMGEGEMRRFLAELNGKDVLAVVSALRERDESLYSHAAIAALHGVTKSTAHRWAKGEG
ncbi:ATP-dependent zinc metalloprotease FtsH 4 [Rubripirellula tenax]|uniref:ATP-dependent zinc metalloprotease FtsH 4 n=1 Tax=Rubripirellula tenax TaxID=2528015 RepID=A0A5C6FH02_9BACT|nr:ATP-binding protein [Rubripirellula tenax]TWU58949.1 ATP-dependent zinc metalloprotease FtsH 4 [Rubripirellula tenax]